MEEEQGEFKYSSHQQWEWGDDPQPQCLLLLGQWDICHLVEWGCWS